MDALPLWAVFLVSIALVLVCIKAGFLLGRARRAAPEHEEEGPVGVVAGATLGLLAFLLAFTFGIAADRFQARKQVLLDEVNAIDVAYHRVGIVREPQRSAMRSLLREYVDGRIGAVNDRSTIPATIERAYAIHRELWSHARAVADLDLNSDIGALVVEAVNDLLVLHTTRATVAFQYRVPRTIWVTLVVVAIVSMAMVGYTFGLSGAASRRLDVALAITFASVVWLNADLDRPTEGSLQVSQQPMIELRARLAMPPP